MIEKSILDNVAVIEWSKVPTMDIDPIYCAEQIVVPPDLADVLKAYTKEVIRRQPENLVEFSAIYFANLANVAKGVKRVEPPSKEQLRLVIGRASGDPYLTSAQVLGLCQQAGIAEPVISKAMSVGSFNDQVEVDRFIFLMVSMACENFSALVSGMFDVWGIAGSLDTPKFLQLLAYLGPDMDPEITSEFLSNLELSLLAKSVTMPIVMSHPLLQPKFD